MPTINTIRGSKTPQDGGNAANPACAARLAPKSNTGNGQT